MIQETPEEAAETELYQTINKIIDGGKDLPKGHNVTRGQAVDYAFETALKIAKWQQERSYSEEEVKNLVKIIEWYDEASDVRPDYKPNIEERIGGLTMWEWFEQFKKK